MFEMNLDRTGNDWVPNLTYTWTRKQLQQWADNHGSFPVYRGVKYRIKYKPIVPGRYHVSFEVDDE